MVMRLNSWSHSLDWLNSPNGWMLGNDVSTQLARDAINELAERRWIGHWFAAEPQANGKPGKPEAAYRAAELRDVILRLAVVRGLMHQAARGVGDVDSLVQVIVPNVMESCTGLRASSTADATGPYRPADFARSAAALEFFEGVVSPRLKTLDAEFGTSLQSLALRSFTADSPESLEHWGRLWTLGTALIPLSWARARGCTVARDLAHAFWCGRDPAGGVLPRFYVRAGTLPTGSQLPGVDGRVSVHAELRMRPTLAQVIEGRPEWWDLPSDATCAIHVPLKAIDYVTSMVEAEQRVHYRGRNVLQLYLAVLADALLGGDVDRDTPLQLPVSTSRHSVQRPSSALDSPPERALRRLEKAGRPTGPAHPRRIVRQPPAPANAQRPWNLPFTSHSVALDIAQLHLRPANASDSQHWQVFGTLDAWSPFDAEIEGIDWLFVARSGHHRVTLPVFLQISDSDDAHSATNAASLVLEASGTADWPTASWLRQACARNDGVRLACERVGRWAFVVVEFHD